MSGNRKESTNTRPVVEEPPYLEVGTDVSAKYRGAFCEANIKSVKKLVKCKVNFGHGGGSSTVTDDCIIGDLKIGSDVKVKGQDGEDTVATLMKVTDCSSYTVIFDDGDERTLKRTSLCIKGEKHFNESETLDHLPLTDPENFGTPVMQAGKKSRKGRRSSLSVDETESKEEDDVPARKKLNVKDEESVADKVVMIEVTEKKKTIQLPALLLTSSESSCHLKNRENVLVRSFKDGKHIEVHPKHVKEFSKESAVNATLIKGETSALKSAVEHAVKYIETKQLPSNWNDNEPEGASECCANESSSSEAESDGDENDKNKFLEKLNKFLGDKGTPLVRSPVLGHRDLDLYKLHKIVSKMKGMDKVQSWYTVYKKMGIPVVTTTASYHIKNAYKRYLYDFEVHTRQEDENSAAEKSNLQTKGDKSSDIKGANSNQDEEAESDSEKDLKELSLCNGDKLAAQPKATAKKGRGKRRARSDRSKSLRSPSSPTLSPLSPCSPRSISSVSASESLGCPSPADNYCDVRELRGKIDLVLSKSNDKNVTKSDDFEDSKKDLPDKESKVNSNSKTKKETVKTCKEAEIVVKLEKNVANLERKVESATEAVDNFTKDTESTCEEDSMLGVDQKKNCKNSEKEGTLKRNIENEENSKDLKDDGSHLDKGGGDEHPGEDSEDKTEHMDTPMDNQEQDGSDVEDTVDVVNSPTGTSETVDSDDRGERKGDKKSKKKGEGKNGGKSNDTSDDVDELAYKLNDKIEVRYGRGRNATIYHAKITCIDPQAEEGLYYLVHYQGWNARHDEWIGDERIIGHEKTAVRGVKQTRTRTIKEPTKSIKPTPKPTAKPVPKPAAKKNGKNASGHIGRSCSSKAHKRTPSPTINIGASSRNGNGRACKTRKDNSSEKAEPSLEVKYPARVTRRNSLTLPMGLSELDSLDEKSPDTKTDNEMHSVSSPNARTQRSSKSPSPECHIEKASESTVKDEKLEDVKLGEGVTADKKEDSTNEKSVESSPSEMDTDSKVEVQKSLKRPREEDTDTSSSDSPQAKKKPDGKDSSTEDVFETEATKSPTKKEANDPESEPAVDDTNGPDLTCSEQLPTNCASPDPYSGEFPGGERFYRNGVENATTGNGTKEKDSSSSLDEGKVDKPTTPSRRTKCRRDRKTRAPSSQSSIDTTESHNGSSNGPAVTVMLSPSWTPRYNFTEDLDELLKNEESSERIRLLTERIKDIRKVYGELKSEVANIDRKRKRKQKRKREEELSNEENTTRSPSRSSPLTTNTATTSANTLAAVECR